MDRGLAWPTPDAMVANDGEDLALWEARRARVKADKRNGNGFGEPLAVAVRRSSPAWPTPAVSEAERGHGYQRAAGRMYETLTGATGAAKCPARKHRPIAAWEGDTPRTIDPKSDPHRRARLKALGNAVVPQVAEVIGRVLLDIDAQVNAAR